jgi:hypothetical protein
MKHPAETPPPLWTHTLPHTTTTTTTLCWPSLSLHTHTHTIYYSNIILLYIVIHQEGRCQLLVMRKKGRQYAPAILPPNGFFTLEPTLHRCLAPLQPEHLPFLKRLELGAIIAVSPIPFSDNVIAFAENEGISTVRQLH